jgi:hypothetical protein
MTLAASPARPLRYQRPRWPSAFICPITASSGAPRELAFDAAEAPRFWPEMKTRRGFGASWPRYPLTT